MAHVTDVVPASGVTEDGLLAIAATVERRSEHPLARAIVAEPHERGIEFGEPGAFQALPSAGAVAAVDGEEAVVGTPALLAERGVDWEPLAEDLEAPENGGARDHQ
jgi:Cu+-exporting ATPase